VPLAGRSIGGGFKLRCSRSIEKKLMLIICMDVRV
jgi:hypothetical protein